MGALEVIGAVGTIVGTATAVGEAYRRRRRRTLFAIISTSSGEEQSVLLALRNVSPHAVHQCSATASWHLLHGNVLRGLTECETLESQGLLPLFVPASFEREGATRTYLELADEFEGLTIDVEFTRRAEATNSSGIQLKRGLAELALLSRPAVREP